MHGGLRASLILLVAVAVIGVRVEAALAAYVDTVTADHPTGYWRLGDSTGTTAVDNSASQVNGTYVGSPALGQTGAVQGDTAVTFNGTSQYMRVPYTAALN